jgi:hypothetical protein
MIEDSNGYGVERATVLVLKNNGYGPPSGVIGTSIGA